MSTITAKNKRKQSNFSFCIHNMLLVFNNVRSVRCTPLETKFTFDLMMNFSAENRIHLTNVSHKFKYLFLLSVVRKLFFSHFIYFIGKEHSCGKYLKVFRVQSRSRVECIDVVSFRAKRAKLTLEVSMGAHKSYALN